MIFNFFLGNHRDDALNAMSDILAPIYRGLESLGHQVIGFGTGMVAAPAINVVVEAFGDDAFTDALLGMKAAQTEGFVFGVICTDDIDGEFVTDPPLLPNAPPPPDPARRRGNLMRVLPHADFVWPLLPQVARYDELCGPGKTALVDYGFAAACIDPWPVAEPGLRDIDVVIFGLETPYRAQLAADLRHGGLTVVTLSRAFYPDFLADDILRRAKLLIDMKREPAAPFLWPPAAAKGLHFGMAVLSERIGVPHADSPARYTVVCSRAEMPSRATEVIRSQRFAELGRAALSRFQAETSMAANMERALQLPVFQRPAA